MPKREILKACATANPDGFGFVSERDYYKTMSFDRFLDRLAMVNKDEACIIHFRLATHGRKRRGNCHPFKKGDLYFAHNGILPIVPDYDKTDSETAFKRYLAKPAATYGLRSWQLQRAVDAIIGTSKFAFMRDGEIATFGSFVTIDGVRYSNTRWQAYMR